MADEWDQYLVNEQDEWEQYAEPQEKKSFAGGVAESLSQRAGNITDIASKTSIGDVVHNPIGPALHVAGQVAGGINDVVLEGMKAGYRNLIPDVAKDYLESGANAILGSAPVQSGLRTVSNFYRAAKELYPEGMQSVEDVANIAGAIPTVKAVQLGGKALKEGADIASDALSIATRLGEEETRKQIKERIRYGIEKGIRPSVSGKGTASLTEDYVDNANEAVLRIVGNKKNLEFSDTQGNVIHGKLPENLKQTADSIEQTKRSIFRQYDAMKEAAGEGGAKIDLVPIADILKKEAADPVILDNAPNLAKYAANKAAAFENRLTYSADEAQRAIAQYNNALEAFYKNPNMQTANKARIDAIIVKNLRKALDDSITNTTGLGYQELKKAYGSLKAIEKDVNHRAIVDARKNIKGLVDFTDIFTSGELLAGIATMRPEMILRAGSWKAVKEYFKHINNPNTIVKNMFSDVEKSIAKSKGGFKSRTFKAASKTDESLDALGQVDAPTIPVEPFPLGTDAPKSPFNPEMRMTFNQVNQYPALTTGYEAFQLRPTKEEVDAILKSLENAPLREPLQLPLDRMARYVRSHPMDRPLTLKEAKRLMEIRGY